jgi:hypothetical protein
MLFFRIAHNRRPIASNCAKTDVARQSRSQVASVAVGPDSQDSGVVQESEDSCESDYDRNQHEITSEYEIAMLRAAVQKLPACANPVSSLCDCSMLPGAPPSASDRSWSERRYWHSLGCGCILWQVKGSRDPDLIARLA